MTRVALASLRVRLILLVLPALGLTLYNAGQARQRAAAEAQAQAQQLTGLTVSRVAEWMAVGDSTVRAGGRRPCHG
jgi:hypothetical protein